MKCQICNTDLKQGCIHYEKTGEVQWKVNTPQLLKEIIGNNETAVLSKPLTIFGSILYEVGERAAEINDPKLNALMCRLAIYEISDPYNPNYDKEMTDKVLNFERVKP